MTIDEAIENCNKTAKECFENGVGTEIYECGKDFEQLAKWLTELKEVKKILKEGVDNE